MEFVDTRTHCTHGHPFDESNNYRNKKGRYVCRVCNRLRMRRANSTPEAKRKNADKAIAWVNANREHYREYCRNRRQKTNLWLAEYKASKGCSQCGIKDASCLDFHHIDPKAKNFNIGNKASVISLAKLQKEVAKCDVICRNCHSRLHAAERAKLLELKQLLKPAF
jgi:hypothetical protein